MSNAVTFLVGCTYGSERLFVAASPDDDEPYSPYSVWYVFFRDESKDPWTHYVNRWWPVGATVYVPMEKDLEWALVGVSNEGEVDFNYGEQSHSEKISGAGVYSDGAVGWGYISAVRQIGGHLYACGGAGQVYKRLGPDEWIHIDKEILQAPHVDERLLPRAIHGPHENAIYLAGALSAEGLPPRVHFWNGLSWRNLELPEVAERITSIHVESESRIWMCGANGTLLLGNADDGFRSLSTVDDNQLFLSVCQFKDLTYLGSNLGLFVYDPADHAAGIRKVVTGMTPELQDANIVDSVEAVLWSIGPKDIARFDGSRWERIHHPDNPPIGGSAVATNP